MKKIGFLGLGAMGHGMCLNLTKKSAANVVGFDPVDVLRASFVTDGGNVVDNVDEIYSQCDYIILSLPTNEIVVDTVNQIFEKAVQGSVIIDMGSTSPCIIQDLHKKAASKGFKLMDAPVSGGKSKADDGTLVIMCGGEQDVFNDIKPLLLTMGRNATLMGRAGMGSTAKLANNMMVHIHILALAESFAFAKRAGIDPKVLFEAIKDGFAQSIVMDVKLPAIVERDFSPTARLKVGMKDIINAVDMADRLGVDIPLTNMVMDSMHWAVENGLEDEDHCAIVKYCEKMMGVEIC